MVGLFAFVLIWVSLLVIYVYYWAQWVLEIKEFIRDETQKEKSNLLERVIIDCEYQPIPLKNGEPCRHVPKSFIQ